MSPSRFSRNYFLLLGLHKQIPFVLARPQRCLPPPPTLHEISVLFSFLIGLKWLVNNAEQINFCHRLMLKKKLLLLLEFFFRGGGRNRWTKTEGKTDKVPCSGALLLKTVYSPFSTACVIKTVPSVSSVHRDR